MRRLNDGAPTAAGRRGGVERPRASLADPPSISGPAASAWRPMTAACRAHDRAALAARWPWPPPRGAAHHNHKPPQTTAAELTFSSMKIQELFKNMNFFTRKR